MEISPESFCNKRTKKKTSRVGPSLCSRPLQASSPILKLVALLIVQSRSYTESLSQCQSCSCRFCNTTSSDNPARTLRSYMRTVLSPHFKHPQSWLHSHPAFSSSAVSFKLFLVGQLALSLAMEHHHPYHMTRTRPSIVLGGSTTPSQRHVLLFSLITISHLKLSAVGYVFSDW
jgi:hypothetical protein